MLAEYGEDGVTSLRYLAPGDHPPAGTRDEPAGGDEMGARLLRELAAYFAGELRVFSLPLLPAGTAFQREVWDTLRRIPYGESRTYGQLAREMGRPGGARAIGQANGRNPLPILIPCHRVLASGGGIGGYMGDWSEGRGIALKRRLLELERGILTVDL
jgi:methylated-DNA-[protein]-cysteine S-methyltransferase